MELFPEAARRAKGREGKIMPDVSVVIPNYNGIGYLKCVLESLRGQTFKSFETIVVDNGSTDGSTAYVRETFPEVRLLVLSDNTGFAHAVNEGIRISRSAFVLLLNNDTEAAPDFVAKMVEGIRRHPKAFSCQARMMQFHDRTILDGAGDSYSALGWAYARGKGESPDSYRCEEEIFSSCAGAAIYRRKLFKRIGFFDEEHFAYLEDLDIGYRSRIHGYENWYLPDAVVCHVGSGTSGSRYNQFKIRYSSRNNVYLIYKNMPLAQLLLNFPLLAAGFAVKLLYFTMKGYGREYLAGIKNGFEISRPQKKVHYSRKNLKQYFKIQIMLIRSLPGAVRR